MTVPLTPEQIENAIKQIRQGKEVNQQNQIPEMEQPQENTKDMPDEREELDAETMQRQTSKTDKQRQTKTMQNKIG